MIPTKVTSIVQQADREKKRGGLWIIAQLVALAAIIPSEVPQLCREKLTLTMLPLNQYIIVIIILLVSFVDTWNTSRKEDRIW